MSVNSFAEKRDSKRVDYDDAYGYQCVDLVKQYMDEERGYSSVYFYGSAHQGRLNISLDGVRSIPHTAGKQPSAGDVIFYGPTRTNPYGHVAIVITSTRNGALILEQNGQKGSATGLRGDAIRIVFRDYTNVSGWMTTQPPQLSAVERDVIIKLSEARSKAWKVVQDQEIKDHLHEENNRYRKHYSI